MTEQKFEALYRFAADRLQHLIGSMDDDIATGENFGTMSTEMRATIEMYRDEIAAILDEMVYLQAQEGAKAV